VHAVDQQVHVRVFPIPVSDDEHLVLAQPEPLNHAVGDALHRRAVDRVARVEAEREVVDRLLDARVLRRRRLHDPGRQHRVVGGQVAADAPRDPVGLGPRPPGGQIGAE
jgi:hypothetical protein